MQMDKVALLASSLSVIIGSALLPTASRAVTITPGLAFTVANDGGTVFTGTHFHSNTSGTLGNPAGKAEVGSYFDEQARGLAEFSLSGLPAAGPAFVTFDVYQLGGLFQGDGTGSPGNFLVDIYSYVGNNLEDLSDYQAPTTSFLGSLSTAGLSAGQTLSFDVNSILDAAITNGDSSFGIRLQPKTYIDNGPAITFDTFRLTTDKQGTNGNAVPGPLPLFGAATAFGMSRRLRRRIKLRT